MAEFKLGFLGGGMMAQALISGVTRIDGYPPSSIIVSDPFAGCRDALGKLGVTPTASNSEVAKATNVIVIAVKPDVVAAVLTELKDILTEKHLLISIAAGVTIKSLQSRAEKARVIRVMPNTPCLVGCGACAYALGPSATGADGELVQTILGSVGLCLPVPESKLNAVTGLSGSGPAYGYLAIEALSDGGVRAGLPRTVATQLAAQTLLGAATMVLQTGKHPGELKDQVTSPGGTTITAVHSLEKSGFRAALIDAVLAAATKAAELG